MNCISVEILHLESEDVLEEEKVQGAKAGAGVGAKAINYGTVLAMSRIKRGPRLLIR